jgi:hypothetical protein
MSGNNIKVVCRFRPQNKLEIREGGVPIIELNEDGTGVALKVLFFSYLNKKKSFFVLKLKILTLGKRHKYIFI